MFFPDLKLMYAMGRDHEQDSDDDVVAEVQRSRRGPKPYRWSRHEITGEVATKPGLDPEACEYVPTHRDQALASCKHRTWLAYRLADRRSGWQRSHGCCHKRRSLNGNTRRGRRGS